MDLKDLIKPTKQKIIILVIFAVIITSLVIFSLQKQTDTFVDDTILKDNSVPYDDESQIDVELLRKICTSNMGFFVEGYEGRGIPKSVNKCGNFYGVYEEPSHPESVVLIIDKNGEVVEDCQGLFNPEGCTLLGSLSCDSKNLCDDFLKSNTIIIDDEIVNVGENFKLKLYSDSIELKLTRILNDDTIEIEYPGSFLVGPPPHPGGCRYVRDTYTAIIKTGDCLSSNTCDAGTSICFSIKKENAFIKVDYDLDVWDYGI